MVDHPLPRYVGGESIYSFVAQINRYSVDTSGQQTNLRLFQNRHVRLHPVLPAHIEHIASTASVNPYELLLNGTGYSLHAFVLSKPEERIDLMNCMLGPNGGGVISASRQATSKLAFGVNLKLCPCCLLEDEERYGNGYWHTIHQLYGVSVCPIHGEKLSVINAGEGAAGRKYLLPNAQMLQEQLTHSAIELRLSKFITQLHQYLNLISPYESVRPRYLLALHALNLITPNGNLRLTALIHELDHYWGELFKTPDSPVPSKLSSFQFVPKLVHTDVNAHYIKHVLLMAFLADTPEEFFSLKSSVLPRSRTKRVKKPLSDKTSILLHLKNGLSMRKVSMMSGRSIGYIKQLAKRHDINVGSRAKSITKAIERSVWRQAFMGKHRKWIAEYHGISVGSVEQIIQSHMGLSKWRRHLRFVDKLKSKRDELSLFISGHSEFTRKQIIQSCPAYMWLYRNDKKWLYSHIPHAQKLTHHPSVRWDELDDELSRRIESEIKSATSLTEIDRLLGNHGWLPRHKNKLPMTTALAEYIIGNVHKGVTNMLLQGENTYGMLTNCSNKLRRANA